MIYYAPIADYVPKSTYEMMVGLVPHDHDALWTASGNWFSSGWALNAIGNEITFFGSIGDNIYTIDDLYLGLYATSTVNPGQVTVGITCTDVDTGASTYSDSQNVDLGSISNGSIYCKSLITPFSIGTVTNTYIRLRIAYLTGASTTLTVLHAQMRLTLV